MLGVLKMSIATLEGELAKVKSREQAKTATLTKEIALLQYTCEEHSSSVQVLHHHTPSAFHHLPLRCTCTLPEPLAALSIVLPRSRAVT